MNARPSQLHPTGPKGPLSGFLTFLVIQLSGLVDWSKVSFKGAHIGGAEGVTFGTNSCTVGDLITMDTQPTDTAGQIGMNTTSGRPKAFIDGADQELAHSNEVLMKAGGTMAGNVSFDDDFKITNLMNGAAGSHDAATVAQMEAAISDVIAPRADLGYAGEGLLGHGSISEINALTPAIGNVVISEGSGTPSAGTSDALVAGDVAEYDGTSWKKRISASGGYPPVGTRILVSTTSTFISGGGLSIGDDEGRIAGFDGTSLSPNADYWYTPTDGALVAIKGEGALAENKVLVFDGAVPTGVWRETAAAGVAHSALTGLTTGDDHTQYAKIAGRSGGQTLKGGTGSGDNLVLESTANGTKGFVQIASGSDVQMAGDDEFVPATSGNGYVGTSSKKWKEVRALNVYTGDLNMAHPAGDPNKSWKLVEETDGLSATNLGTGVEHRVVMIRKGSVMDFLCRKLG